MKMKSERPLLVDGVPQTEFETNEQHGKELIAKGLAVEVGTKHAKPAEPVAGEATPIPAPAPASAVAVAAPVGKATGKPKNQ